MLYTPKNFTAHKMPYRVKALERDMILFKWKCDNLKLPLNPEFWVTVFGSLGYNLKDKCWVVGSFDGILDEYGDPVRYVCHTLATDHVRTFQLKNHDDVIVCGNTELYRSYEQERDYYSFIKEETDRSILCQLINTRLNKALIAANDHQKDQIVKAYKDVIEGMPLILVTSLLEDLEKIDLTDPREIDKLQYLTSFYATLDKREANNAGIDLETLDKRAQVSTTEIKQYDDFTSMNYLIMYEARLSFMEEMKAAGYNLEIVKNPIFFDEPGKKDVEEGTFEAAEMEDQEVENNEKNNQTNRVDNETE